MTKAINKNFTLLDFVKRKDANRLLDDYGEKLVAHCIKKRNEELDVCDSAAYPYGIGYNELRFIGLDSCGKPYFESNNIHDWERGDDVYCQFHWCDLSAYEREAIVDFLCFAEI